MTQTNGIKKASDLLREIMEIKHVEAVFLIGRDGFIIESRGLESGINMDNVGASVAGAISRILELEKELDTKNMKEMYVEFFKKMMICLPVGDLFLAVAATDTSNLASLRFKLKNIIPQIIEFD
jgi:predicted regulator of Ras-like GTPase activity (Roadblock/LC7/MglB family)